MTLSRLYRRRNQPEQARRAARTAAVHFRSLAEEDREDWQLFLQWGLNEVLAEEFATAVRILERVRPRADDPEPFREALVLAYLGWFDQAMRQEPGDVGQQLELLNRALIHGPENPRVLTLIANLSTRPLEGQEAELAEPLTDALQRALAAGVAPAVVHLILGTRQLVDGDTDNAVMHLELAHQANAQVPSVLNNLAWGLAHQDQPDLERALTLIDIAAELSDRPRIVGTRAVILDLMGKQQEAVTELENVLRRHPDPAWVHEQLADLYRRLGDAAGADEHQRLAREAGKARDATTETSSR
jgi:tetratricopeptide (TPR) repeat protein